MRKSNPGTKNRIWSVIIGLEIAFIVIVSIVTLLRPSQSPRQAQERSTPQESGRSLQDSIRVPDLLGMTALTAHARLVKLGLELGNVRATRGPAGLIVRTHPAASRPVPSGTQIDIFVGVEAARLGQTTGGSG